MHPDTERDRHWNTVSQLVPAHRVPRRVTLGLLLVRLGLRLAPLTADDVRDRRRPDRCLAPASTAGGPPLLG